MVMIGGSSNSACQGQSFLGYVIKFDLELEKYDTNFMLPALVEVRVCNTIYNFLHGLPFTIYSEQLAIESYSELHLSFQVDQFLIFVKWPSFIVAEEMCFR